MTVSIHQVNALLNRLIQQDLRPGMRAAEGGSAAGGQRADRVNISEAARAVAAGKTHNLDEYLVHLYSRAAREHS